MSPVIICLLVASLGLCIGDEAAAGVALAVVCAVIEFFLPVGGSTPHDRVDEVTYDRSPL